jgi:hypothetical protein
MIDGTGRNDETVSIADRIRRERCLMDIAVTCHRCGNE